MTESNEIWVRLADESEADCFLDMVDALADFENLEGPSLEARERLRSDGFGESRRFQPWLALLDGAPVGYAVTFQIYSTFRALPILYLEDLFVTPEAREKGVATAIMRFLAGEAIRQGCAAMQWAVLDWNERAIAFYERMGATQISEWFSYRLGRPELEKVAGRT